MSNQRQRYSLHNTLCFIHVNGKAWYLHTYLLLLIAIQGNAFSSILNNCTIYMPQNYLEIQIFTLKHDCIFKDK